MLIMPCGCREGGRAARSQGGWCGAWNSGIGLSSFKGWSGILHVEGDGPRLWAQEARYTADNDTSYRLDSARPFRMREVFFSGVIDLLLVKDTLRADIETLAKV